MTKRKIIIIIIIVALLFIALIVGVFFYLSRVSSKEKNNSNKGSTNSSSSTNNSTKKTSESSKTTCPAATFTSDETLNIASWKTFENSAYTFKYPETWTVASNEANFVNLKDSEANINFEIRRGSKIDDTKYSSGWAQESITNITVNCRSARRDLIHSSSTDYAIYVPIFKEGSTTEKDYTVTMDFDYVGASISGDIIDAFDTLLKTFAFK